MKFFPNLIDGSVEAGAWAVHRENEGWPGIRTSDHLWLLGQPARHLWVTLTEMALATSNVEIGSSFSNNLFRSPVEFAQAARALQRVSNGRFEAGLGAGWNREEIERTGRQFPPPRARAGMYREAVYIARELLHHGRCTFAGEYYEIDVAMIGPEVDAPPPLAVSVGGPRTIREVSPLADRIELKANSRSTRGGGTGDRQDMTLLAEVDVDDLRRLIDLARQANDSAPLGLFAMVAVGDGPEVRARQDALGDSLFGGMVGEVSKVVDNLLSLEDLGITRVQITEYSPRTFEALAPHLANAHAST